MSGTPRTTLKPGDVLFWAADPEDETREGTPILVEDDGLRVVFSPYLWHHASGDERGLTTQEAEAVLRGEAQFRLPGYIYKAYDEESGRSFPDPQLEESV